MLEPEYSDDYTDPRLAIFYDQMNPWCPSDDFYLDLVMSSGAVLDVGCGTGAVAPAGSRDGYTGRLVGLDPAAAMLDQAKVAADVDGIHGDLGTVSFDHEFDLVIMTGHVFQVFLTDDDIARTLTAVRTALARWWPVRVRDTQPGATPVGAVDGLGRGHRRGRERRHRGEHRTPHRIDGQDGTGPDVDRPDVNRPDVGGQVVEVVGRFRARPGSERCCARAASGSPRSRRSMRSCPSQGFGGRALWTLGPAPVRRAVARDHHCRDARMMISSCC